MFVFIVFTCMKRYILMKHLNSKITITAAIVLLFPGCFQAPRFVSFSIATEPASLLNFDTQISKSR